MLYPGLNIGADSLVIVDMQTELLPILSSKGFIPGVDFHEIYNKVRATLVANTIERIERSLKNHDNIVMVELDDFGLLIPELVAVKDSNSRIVSLVKNHDGLLETTGTKEDEQRFNINKQVADILLQGSKLQLAGINTTSCVLSTAIGLNIRKGELQSMTDIEILLDSSINAFSVDVPTGFQMLNSRVRLEDVIGKFGIKYSGQRLVPDLAN